MRSETTKRAGQDRWLLSAGWVAGIGIMLVEMQIGMDYVFARVENHLGTVVGWLPIIQTLVWQVWGSAGR